MNSLTYLSRQFDVLASPRAPPSTPVSESPPPLPGDTDHADPRRLRSWSTRSLRVPLPTGSSGPWSIKRSLSSPADVAVSVDQPLLYPTRNAPLPPSRPPSKPSSRRPSFSSSERAIRPISGSNSILRSLFFTRLVLSFWNAICSAWRSLTGQSSARTVDEVAVEDASEEEEKDTEDESKDERSVPLDHPQRIPPPLPLLPFPPPDALTPSYPISPTVSHSLADIPSSVDSDSASQSTSTAASSQQLPSASRSSTPGSATHRTPVHLQKTLVLDLDETLIHSTSRPISSMSSSSSGLLGLSIFGRRNKGAGHVVEVVLGGRSTLYHVYKRPFVDYFLRKVSGWYTLVIFTASMQEYADPVIDWLDAGRGILTRRLFRESCTQLPSGSYTKDLSVVETDLARVCLIDNSPICYSVNEANGIPIEGWTHDPHDEALLDLLPVLDSLRFTKDVRRVLGIRGFS
ncbi:uncharacterized protein FIBRA_06222 [Fibroporia radiculosa]|uniref:FCP1 homology domain-containing protein n=1 Tax=Fibroporia radiculosa TaxID=599839 RepID=J4GAU7_9APHY|nr:uncharacterized protein FIBRA_06222 [Fibroporia radiculosa]CCM04063.1 predicted protein [Fibroporia radiculosa]